MAKEYRVSKAFQSTDRDTKEPTVVNTRGGEMHKFMFQLEGRDTWFSALKKPGNKVEEGSTLYGNIIEDGQFGKPEFKSEQRPFGEGGGSLPQSKPASAPSSSQPGLTAQERDSIVGKLDYIISLLENRSQFPSNEATTAAPSDSGSSSSDIDLNELDY